MDHARDLLSLRLHETLAGNLGSESDDCGEWCPQLMADAGNELVLRPHEVRRSLLGESLLGDVIDRHQPAHGVCVPLDRHRPNADVDLLAGVAMGCVLGGVALLVVDDGYDLVDPAIEICHQQIGQTSLVVEFGAADSGDSPQFLVCPHDCHARDDEVDELRITFESRAHLIPTLARECPGDANGIRPVLFHQSDRGQLEHLPVAAVGHHRSPADQEENQGSDEVAHHHRGSGTRPRLLPPQCRYQEHPHRAGGNVDDVVSFDEEAPEHGDEDQGHDRRNQRRFVAHQHVGDRDRCGCSGEHEHRVVNTEDLLDGEDGGRNKRADGLEEELLVAGDKRHQHEQQCRYPPHDDRDVGDCPVEAGQVVEIREERGAEHYLIDRFRPDGT